MDDALKTVIDSYVAAWNEPDPDRRLAALHIAWAADGAYQDPTGEATGRQALSDHIGGVVASVPGARVEITSGIDRHHDSLRFAWRMCAADGSVLVEGIDFATLAGDGRLASLTGFFGTVPAA